MCDDLQHCEIVSEIPDCGDITRNNYETDVIDETTNRNYYSVVKRDTSRMQIITPKNNPNMKIKIYTKISKGLGLWNQSLSRAENLEIVKQELRTYQNNERLRTRLHSLRINVKHLNLEENLLCRSGSVLKRNVCGEFNAGMHARIRLFFFNSKNANGQFKLSLITVQCPRGTFHNKSLNSCQLCKLGHYNDKEGQVDCQNCPRYQSTRKLGAKKIEECIGILLENVLAFFCDVTLM